MPSTRPAALLFLLGVSTLLLSSILVLWPGWDGEANARDGETRKTPDFEILATGDAPGVRQLDVATSAEREAGMRLVVEKLREENTPENGTLLVEFKDLEDTSRDTGFALAYDNKKAVMQAGETDRFGEVYDEADAKRIMTEEDGVSIVGFEDFAQSHPGVWENVKRFLR